MQTPPPSYEESLTRNAIPVYGVPTAAVYQLPPPLPPTDPPSTQSSAPADPRPAPPAYQFRSQTTPVRPPPKPTARLTPTQTRNRVQPVTVQQPAQNRNEEYNDVLISAMTIHAVQLLLILGTCCISYFTEAAQDFYSTSSGSLGAYVLLGVFFLTSIITFIYLAKQRDTKGRESVSKFALILWEITFGLLMNFMCGAFRSTGIIFGLSGCILLFFMMILWLKFKENRSEMDARASLWVCFFLMLFIAGISFVPAFFLGDELRAAGAPVLVVFLGFTLFLSAGRSFEENAETAKIKGYVPAKSEMEFGLGFLFLCANLGRCCKLKDNKT